MGGGARPESEGVGVQRARFQALRSECGKATVYASILTTSSRNPPSIHFHGLELPNDQDGVPFITQPPVKPGAVVYLRVHRAECRLTHVSLAS